MTRSTRLSMGWMISGMLARPTSVGTVLSTGTGARLSRLRVAQVILERKIVKYKKRYINKTYTSPRTKKNLPLGFARIFCTWFLLSGSELEIRCPTMFFLIMAETFLFQALSSMLNEGMT